MKKQEHCWERYRAASMVKKPLVTLEGYELDRARWERRDSLRRKGMAAPNTSRKDAQPQGSRGCSKARGGMRERKELYSSSQPVFLHRVSGSSTCPQTAH